MQIEEANEDNRGSWDPYKLTIASNASKDSCSTELKDE